MGLVAEESVVALAQGELGAVPLVEELVAVAVHLVLFAVLYVKLKRY